MMIGRRDRGAPGDMIGDFTRNETGRPGLLRP
jgi:hypothetical protein